MNNKNINGNIQVNEDQEIPGNATKLSAMDLNYIKLDPKHTLLTPDYLEKFTETKET